MSAVIFLLFRRQAGSGISLRPSSFSGFCKRAVLFFALAVLFLLPGRGLGDTPVLAENAWNYVDASLDISLGIPEGVTGQLAVIRDRGVLRVATEPYYPPQEYIDPSLSGQDQYVGADMDLARLIAQRMGVTLEIVPMEFSEVLNAVADGSCDLAIAALSYTPSRAAFVELSKGYHYAEENQGSGILVRQAEQAQYPDLQSLESSVLAAQRGSLQESVAADHIQLYLEFRRLPTVQEIYDALISGEIDAAVIEMESTEIWLESHPDSGLVLLPDLRFTLAPEADGHRVAARKGEIMLTAFINGVIDEVLNSGQYEAWIDEHNLKLTKPDGE